MSERRRKAGKISEAQAWEKAAHIVSEHSATLKTLETHAELYAFAKEHSLNTVSLFPKYKTELRKQLDVDYEQMRDRAQRQRLAEIESAAQSSPNVILYCHGDAEVSAFAVCGQDGEHAWYGEFHENDHEYRAGDQDSAELSAASKAVFLAGQIRLALNLDAIRLTLRTPAHQVGAAELARAAIRAGVSVEVEVLDENPALEVVRLPGWQSWREIRLTDLVTDLSGEAV